MSNQPHPTPHLRELEFSSYYSRWILGKNKGKKEVHTHQCVYLPNVLYGFTYIAQDKKKEEKTD